MLKNIIKLLVSHNDSKIILDNLEIFLTEINLISKFMLYDRFQPVIKSKVKSTHSNTDYRRLIGDLPLKKEKVKVEELNLLDIIKFFKLLENYTLRWRWMSGIENLRLGKFRSNCQNIIDSLSTLFGCVDRLDNSIKAPMLNLIFSAIVIYRLFKVKAIPDISTITAEYSGEDLDIIIFKYFNHENIEKWIKSFLSKFSIHDNPIRLVMYSGNASSPNSGASTNSLYSDVAAVKSDTKLWDSIIKMASFFQNGDGFIKLISAMIENIQFNNEYIHSRLFHFSASGGKARIIANVDWVTQTALSGIHFLLFAILKTIESDFTFDHKKAIDHVLKSEKIPGFNYYSIDLSAATDRLPVILQSKLLEGLFNFFCMNGAEIASTWLSIMDRTFQTTKALNNEQPVKYRIGQGMGIFTSFPCLSLMHHFIINFIVGIPMNRYCLVGDDLLFYGTYDDFLNYLDFMQSIGVKVNLNKTIESKSAERPTIEFARNFIIDGIKINPIPFGVFFAWNDSKVNFETLAWYFLNTMNMKNFLDIIIELKIEITSEEIYSLGYYIYKIFKIEWNEMYTCLEQVHTLPVWFTKKLIDRAIEIIEFDQPLLNSVPFINSSFTSSYGSACVVRLREEIERNHLIASSIRMLAIVDKSLIDITEAIHSRLNSTELRIYDCDLKGSPVLSKRERNLFNYINEITNTINAKE